MSKKGISWTQAELALAIRLTCKLGYQFEQAAKIMARHGYILRHHKDISKKVEIDAPNSWAKISQSQKKRKTNTLCGVPAPPPPRRFQQMPEKFLAFVSTQTLGQSVEQVCWNAINSGFNCNITDVEMAGNRINYEFCDLEIAGISISRGIFEDRCLWPISNQLVCGEKREIKKYCSAHYCRSLG